MDYKEKRRKYLGKTISIVEAERENYLKNKIATKNDEDSVLRRKIHEYIRCLKGKSKQEALKALYERFSDEKYQKYYKFFETWVESEVVDIER